MFHDFDNVNAQVTSQLFYFLTYVTKLRIYNLSNKIHLTCLRQVGLLSIVGVTKRWNGESRIKESRKFGNKNSQPFGQGFNLEMAIFLFLILEDKK